jgi:phosphatidylserine/phosphatidylglycerophosphate/cardiolipin synthase-like enzyme
MRLLDEATQTVDIAQYNIRSERFLTKLVELQQRGVRVRICVDKKNAEQPYNTLDDAMEAAGLDLLRVLNDRSSFAIMHHKFTVVDGRTVMTGSYNWNETAQEVNEENMLVLRDAGPRRGLHAGVRGAARRARGAPAGPRRERDRLLLARGQRPPGRARPGPRSPSGGSSSPCSPTATTGSRAPCATRPAAAST